MNTILIHLVIIMAFINLAQILGYGKKSKNN